MKNLIKKWKTLEHKLDGYQEKQNSRLKRGGKIVAGCRAGTKKRFKALF